MCVTIRRIPVNKAQVFVFEEVPSVDRGAGVSSKPLVREATGSTAFVNGVTTFPSGAAIPLHTHNVDESVTLLEGTGQFESEGRVQNVRPWDTVFAPANVPHRFINTGDGIMRILWVYGGIRVTRTFVETGETVDHLSEEDTRATSSG
jgi:putative monooxygenase